MSHLVLASASPQRKRLLEGLGLTFDIHPSDYDESTCEEKDPVAKAKFLAWQKANTVNASYPDAYVIGCDTLVVAADGSLLEKAPDADSARSSIEKLSGASCEVHSALSVVDPNQDHHEGVSSSTVTFKELSDEEIDWWISTNLWKDRSGSFQIDGPGQLMISKIEGDWSSVVGLPVYLLGDLLRNSGYDIFAAGR